MTLQTQIEAALYEVIDPELGVNIMDLGLIYGIQIDDDNNVTITMTLTTPGCPMHDTISNGVKYRVGQMDGIGEIDVNIVWEPAWSPANMSDHAKDMLGIG
ncbi:metal-sulfur cluster assembly factor [Virgibacillus oceani]|uniref:DNA methyltransferase n=1 Tax=Virgibacillus oceani TaxID=1479511 RepID=A0A917HDH6_9BACI|nr:iron-sulfur cluster assembly protein [Virgibacillus oceani]GGG75466.1 DNA methyltransferase [Virgibacillus oceani]